MFQTIFRRIILFFLFLVAVSAFGKTADWPASDEPVPAAEAGGVPVTRFGYTWVPEEAPDLLPDRTLQRGNENPREKVRPKSSGEISSNFIGLNSTRMPRSRAADIQPLEAVNLIDGNRESCWMSRGQRRADVFPVWIRLDFPVERTIEKITLRTRPNGPARNQYSYSVIAGGNEVGRGLPKSLTIKAARDGYSWETLFDGTTPAPAEGDENRVEFLFPARPVKQILLETRSLSLVETMYALSLAELEACDTNGKNVALITAGTGVTVSSTEHGPGNEIEMHRWLWPIQAEIGAKWLRIGYHDDPINWHHVEKTKGIFELDPVADAAITEMADAGVNIVACIDFGNRLYSGPSERALPQMWEWYWDLPKPPTTPEALAAWDRYVEYIVTRLAGRVQYFEVWNEWDIALYWGEAVSLDNYLTLAKRTIPIIRRCAPNAKILSGSVSGGGFPFGCRAWSDADWSTRAESNIYLKMFRELAPLVDIIGWHPYYNPDPNTLVDYPEDVRALKKWLASIGFQGSCMCTEWNFSAHYPHFSPEEAGKFFGGGTCLSEMEKAKTVAQCYAQDAGLDLASFFCEIYNPYHAADLSLLRRTVDADPVSTLQPQAGFYVVRNLATMLDTFEPADFPVKTESESAPEKIRLFTFKTPDGFAVALWQKGRPGDSCEYQSATLRIPRAARSAAALEPINGVAQELTITSENGQTTLENLLVGDAPLIVRFRE